MNRKEYKNIYESEAIHFYYQSIHHNIQQLLTKFAPSKNKLRILDGGCGTGLLAIKLSKFGEVFPVDESNEAIRFCKRRGLDNVKKASIMKLPFNSNFFDIVTSVDVLYHKKVTDDKKALKEFYRVLKPQGILTLKVPAYEHLRRKHDLLVHTKHRYGKRELKNKIEKAGFTILFLSHGHLLLYPIVILKKFLEGHSDSKNTSDVNLLAQPLNKMLFLLSNLEGKIMLRLGLPTGISLYAVAQKS